MTTRKEEKQREKQEKVDEIVRLFTNNVQRKPDLLELEAHSFNTGELINPGTKGVRKVFSEAINNLARIAAEFILLNSSVTYRQLLQIPPESFEILGEGIDKLTDPKGIEHKPTTKFQLMLLKALGAKLRELNLI
ncbi:hypothetical protein IPJ91_01110 [bacterium]|nr:MAG: hypothetical protein IPJ91_01110 [bacterium]